MNNKLKIIEVSDYILAVSDEEIKDGFGYDGNIWEILHIGTGNNQSYGFCYVKEHNLEHLGYSKVRRELPSNLVKIIAYQLKENALELDLPLLPEIVVKSHILEDRIYCVDVQNYEFDTAPQTWDDEKFMSEAEIQGNVYSVEGFITAFNKTEVNQNNLIIRLIKAEIIVENEVEKLCWRLFGGSFEARGVESEEEADKTVSFGIECYKAATKKYSEDDLRKAFEGGWKNGRFGNYPKNHKEYQPNFTEFIQSLKQPKTPKWFVAEKEKPSDSFRSWLKTFTEGNTMLKTTTINGKTYLVGTYLYN
jgi:hypothetical protein